MLRDIALYLDGQKIDWAKTPDILLTYQRTDYTNPTVTKNMFSKTITVDGTPTNNNIFNHIWNLERCMDEGFTLFNPSQRVDFELFNGAELVESGYAKLDSIQRNGHKIAYNITLYGGLGSFFYSLAYDINTDKERTLADLNYLGTSNPDDEFDFEINKNTVYNAWDALKTTGHNSGSYKKWDYINFIPAYNGVPDDFDADRVLMNIHGLPNMQVRYTTNNGVQTASFPTYITDDEGAYKPFNGYLTAEMRRECDEWEMRDLRSYLQRPALSVKGMFNAICDPQNNGGYNVRLDSNFFSSGNPYYDKAWITLPMLNPDTEAVDKYDDWVWYKADQYTFIGDGPKEMKWKIATTEPDPIVGTPDVFQMKVEIHATITGTSAEKLYTSAINNNGYDPDYIYDPDDPSYFEQLKFYGCHAIQMYGYGNGGIWYNQRQAKCGSPVIALASKVEGQYIGTQSINTWWGDRPYRDSGIQYNFGYWKKVSGSDYVWHNETDNTDVVTFTMETNLMSEIPNIGMMFSSIMVMNGAHVHQKAGKVFDSQWYEYYGAMNQGSFTCWKEFTLDSLESKIIYKVNGKMRSFQPITKKSLLGGLEGTPCDWLLSYCKLFGLFIEKDKYENTIYIKMRNNWYKNEVVDLDDLIDRSKEININPLTFESKWYNFKYGEANGKFLDRYFNTYSQDFGKQLIDTRYYFNAEEIDLLEDTKFRNGLTALEKSNYFNTKYDQKGFQIPQCLFDWCTVTYYSSLTETLETNMCLPQITTMDYLNANTPEEFYDAIPKLHCKNDDNGSTDGDGVLVFFNGIKNTGVADYWLSDDIDEMFIDSDSPCWLQTRHEWSVDSEWHWAQRIAIELSTLPQFTRYMTRSNTITADWDFGYTKELYVPYYRFDVNRTPTVYENFWRSYIRDLYSVDTRVVECNVNLNENNVYDFMKKFYWWDNSIWVCTLVSDYDMALEKSTKCSFTKVNDMAAYLEMPTFNDDFFNFYRSDCGHNIPASGTPEELTFTFGLDCSTDWTVVDDGSDFASFDPNSPLSGSFVVGQEIKASYLPNTSPAPRYCLYSAFNSYGDGRMIRVWQNGYQKEKKLTVTPSSVVLPKSVDSASTASVVVDSSADWFLTAPLWVVIPQHSTSSGVTTLTISAETNNTGAVRVGQVTFNNNDGLQAVLTVKQKGNAKVTLEQNSNGWPITEVPASGRSVSYRLVNDIECTVEPLGNTENYAVASGLVTYHTTVQPSSGTNFYISASTNTSTVTRNIAFYASYVEDGGRYVVMPTVVPLPLVQEASGNTIEQFNNKGGSGSTALGANYAWTATTNNSWITITTPTGSSSTHNVQYEVDENTGGFRTGYIKITYLDEIGFYCSETIVIEQEGVDTPWVVNPTAITTSDRGGSYVISVTASSRYTVSIADNWITKENARDGSFVLVVAPNNGLVRTANVVITADGTSKTVVVNQASSYPVDYTLDYSPQNIILDASGSTEDVIIRSDSNWTITEGNNQQ